MCEIVDWSRVEAIEKQVQNIDQQIQSLICCKQRILMSFSPYANYLSRFDSNAKEPLLSLRQFCQVLELCVANIGEEKKLDEGIAEAKGMA